MELYKSKYSDGKTDGRNSRRDNKTSRSFRNSGVDRGSRNDRRDESTTVTCADCGDECTVPFVPRSNKPVYCPEMIEVQDIPEMIEVQDIPEMIEVQDIPEMIEVQEMIVETNLQL
jgi:CxxC-x17-CxxC domain-containing protein